MGRFKLKKKDVYIDMTAMSDVTVLLLTFFMLTSTFIKPEPVKVNTPGSVSDIKIPEANVLTITVDKDGRVFLALDKVCLPHSACRSDSSRRSSPSSPKIRQLSSRVPSARAFPATARTTNSKTGCRLRAMSIRICALQ